MGWESRGRLFEEMDWNFRYAGCRHRQAEREGARERERGVER